MIRPSVLLFALLMSAPALYRYVRDQITVAELLLRFLIAVPIAAILLAVYRFATAGYGARNEPATPMTPTPGDPNERR